MILSYKYDIDYMIFVKLVKPAKMDFPYTLISIIQELVKSIAVYKIII